MFLVTLMNMKKYGKLFSLSINENEYYEFTSSEDANRWGHLLYCLLYTSPSPRDRTRSRMPSSA